MLCVVYPEEEWIASKFFFHSDSRFWSTLYNQRIYLDRIAKDLNVRGFEDWYTIRSDNVIAHGGARVLAQYGDSLMKGTSANTSSR